jgi:hypothetical protein
MKIKYFLILYIIISSTKAAKLEKFNSLTNVNNRNIDISKIKDSQSEIDISYNSSSTSKSNKQDEISFFSKLNNYFRKSSINDPDITLSALISFITGIIVFFISSFIIIRNERRNIKEIQLIDCYNKSNFCEEIDIDKTGTLHIINGKFY